MNTVEIPVSGPITVQHAELGLCQQVPVKDFQRATPGHLMTLLIQRELIPAESAVRPYLLQCEGNPVDRAVPFAAQGIVPGSVLTVLTRGIAAAPADRRRLDWETFRTSLPQGGKVVRAWRAFRSIPDAERGVATQDGALAAVYDVELHLALPTSATAAADRWLLRLDASLSQYPQSAPRAHILTSPRPWNPHVRPADGWVCNGTLWRPSKLLAFYVLDALRVLNFDFGMDAGSYDGHFAPDAVGWWRDLRGGRPLHQGIYPTILTPQAQTFVTLQNLFGDL
jgi:hypothetical protein